MLLGILSIKFLINSFLSSSLGCSGFLLIWSQPTFALSNFSIVGFLSSSPSLVKVSKAVFWIVVSS